MGGIPSYVQVIKRVGHAVLPLSSPVRQSPSFVEIIAVEMSLSYVAPRCRWGTHKREVCLYTRLVAGHLKSFFLLAGFQ